MTGSATFSVFFQPKLSVSCMGQLGRGLAVGSQIMPLFPLSTDLQGSWAGRSSFSDVTMRWEQQRGSLQTQHRGRGCVVSRCTETGNLSCSPYSSPNLFLRHSSPAPPRIPQPPFLLRPWTQNRDALLTPFYSALPPQPLEASCPTPILPLVRVSLSS